MAFVCDTLLFWVFQLVSLMIIVLDCGCLIYTGVELIPSGSLFGKTLTQQDQDEAFVSLWVCGLLIVAPVVVCVAGVFSRKAAYTILTFWYGYAITYGDNTASRLISVLYYMQVQWPLEEMGVVERSEFEWCEEELFSGGYWWWFARVTLWSFTCWWWIEAWRGSRVASEDVSVVADDVSVVHDDVRDVRDLSRDVYVDMDVAMDLKVSDIVEEVRREECLPQVEGREFVEIPLDDEEVEDGDGQRQEKGDGQKRRGAGGPHLKWFIRVLRLQRIMETPHNRMANLVEFARSLRHSHLLRRFRY